MASVAEIIDELGLDYTETANSVIIPCIFHDETKPSFFISKASGLCHCFSCNAGMTFVQFIQEMRGSSIGDAIAYLYKRNGGNGASSRVLTRSEFSAIACRQKYLNSEAESYPEVRSVRVNPVSRHPYLVNKRGFTIAEVKQHNMSVVTDPSWPSFLNWIYIPVYQDGKLRTYFLRDVRSSGKIYGFYRSMNEEGQMVHIGYPRRDILYNLDNCPDLEAPIAVSEGIFDSIYAGRVVAQSVASLANRVLYDQIQKLIKYKHIYLFPDNDSQEQGLYLLKSLVPYMYKTDINVCILPEHRKDAATCSIFELKNAYTNAVKLKDFIFTERYFKFLAIDASKKGRKSKKTVDKN